MQDQLEKYIVRQKDQLDVFEPDDRLWERIDRELNGTAVRKLNFWSLSWKAAAAVAMLMAAGALLWWVSKQSPATHYAEDSSPDTNISEQTNPQAYYTAELVEVESYYSEQISDQKAQIETFREQGIVLDEALYKQMEVLGEAYSELQSELLQTEDQELIVNAMIQNLMMQMQMLNQQLMILDEIKTKQAEYGKQTQA